MGEGTSVAVTGGKGVAPGRVDGVPIGSRGEKPVPGLQPVKIANEILTKPIIRRSITILCNDIKF